MKIGPALLVLFRAYRWTGRLNELIGPSTGLRTKKKGNETDYSNSH